MDLKELREQKGISRSQMVRDVSRHIRGFAFNDYLLSQYENGDMDSARSEQVFLALKKAYPQDHISEKKKVSVFRKFDISLVVVSFILLVFGLSIAAQIFFRDHPYLQRYKEVVVLAGALVTAFGGILGYMWKKKR